MKHRDVIAVAAAAVAGIGTGLGLTGCASTATAVTAETVTAAKSPHYVVLDCGLKPAATPASYILTCADAGTGLQDMHWTSWTPSLASGYGTFYQNDCNPDCADGKIIRYPVLATFWGSAAVRGYPADRRYTELTVIFPGKRPPIYGGPGGKTSYPLTQTFAPAP
jgi:hypothetical protein